MPKIHHNDIEIYYEQHGDGEPLLLIAGMSVDHTAWLPILDGLSKKFQVTIFDNRGCGQTSSPKGPYTLQQMADDTAALMTALHLDQAHILGGSLGGAIAQHLAIRHPEKVNKLILSTTMAKADPRCTFIIGQRIPLWEQGISTEIIYETIFFPWGFSKQFFTDLDAARAAINEAATLPPVIDLVGYQAQFAALVSHDTRQQLSSINAPTLVLSSEEDILTPPSDGQYLANHIPNAQYHEFAAQAHTVHIEAPQAYLKVVNDFLG